MEQNVVQFEGRLTFDEAQIIAGQITEAKVWDVGCLTVEPIHDLIHHIRRGEFHAAKDLCVSRAKELRHYTNTIRVIKDSFMARDTTQPWPGYGG